MRKPIEHLKPGTTISTRFGAVDVVEVRDLDGWIDVKAVALGGRTKYVLARPGEMVEVAE